MPLVLLQGIFHPSLLIIQIVGIHQLGLWLERNLAAHVGVVELGHHVAVRCHLACILRQGGNLVVPFMTLEVIADHRRGGLTQGREAGQVAGTILFVTVVIEYRRWSRLCRHHQDVCAVEWGEALTALAVTVIHVVHVVRHVFGLRSRVLQRHAVAGIKLVVVGAAPVLVITPICVLGAAGPHLVVRNDLDHQIHGALTLQRGGGFVGEQLGEVHTQRVAVALTNQEVFREVDFGQTIFVGVVLRHTFKVVNRSHLRRKHVVHALKDIVVHDGVGGVGQQHHVGFWSADFPHTDGAFGLHMHATQWHVQQTVNTVTMVAHLLKLALGDTHTQGAEVDRVGLVAEAFTNGWGTAQHLDLERKRLQAVVGVLMSGLVDARLDRDSHKFHVVGALVKIGLGLNHIVAHLDIHNLGVENQLWF